MRAPGCDPLKLYLTKPSYVRHQVHRHSGRWPWPCRFPGCSSKEPFKTEKGLIGHLDRLHGLSTYEARLPYMPPKQAIRRFTPQSCFIAGCSSRATFLKKSKIVYHLQKHHKMTAEESEARAEQEAHWEMHVPEDRPLQPSQGQGCRPSAALKRKHAETADKENEV